MSQSTLNLTFLSRIKSSGEFHLEIVSEKKVMTKYSLTIKIRILKKSLFGGLSSVCSGGPNMNRNSTFWDSTNTDLDKS